MEGNASSLRFRAAEKRRDPVAASVQSHGRRPTQVNFSQHHGPTSQVSQKSAIRCRATKTRGARQVAPWRREAGVVCDPRGPVSKSRFRAAWSACAPRGPPSHQALEARPGTILNLQRTWRRRAFRCSSRPVYRRQRPYHPTLMPRLAEVVGEADRPLAGHLVPPPCHPKAKTGAPDSKRSGL